IAVATNSPGIPIPVGTNPRGVAITPDGQTVYVTNLGDNTVTPIDVATNTPSAPIPVGNDSLGVAMTPAPISVSAPSISGSAQQGDTLTAIHCV
ncbi:MAG TPA: YVTN family beta-propeller repeat-containing protein, partial [Candidatus Dormibacteraeota bacterium]